MIEIAFLKPRGEPSLEVCYTYFRIHFPHFAKNSISEKGGFILDFGINL